MGLVVDFTAGYSQSFPSTTAQLQALFPSATNPLIYLCNELGGNLSEAQGGTAFNQITSPKYGLATPFSSSKLAVEIVDTSSQFQHATTTAFDPAGGSLTLLIAFRAEHIRSANAAICGKFVSGPGYFVYIDSGDNLHVFYSDGTHTSTVSTANGDYGQGVYHLIAVTFNAAGSVTIYTEEETVTQSVPVGFSWPAFTNTVNATLGNTQNLAAPLYGSIAYFAGFAGTITAGQFSAWATWGAGNSFPNITYTPSGSAGIGLCTYDFRDPLNPRVRKHGHSQFPLAAPIDRLGIADGTTAANLLAQPENLEGSSWTTNGSGLYVVQHQGADPGYGYNACLLLKTAAGPTPSRRQTLGAQITQGYLMASVWLRSSDGSTHTAALQCTYGGDGGDGGGQIVTNLVTVTGTWQLVTVCSNKITYSTGTTFIFDVFPVDPNNASATGGVLAWGAMISAVSAGCTIPPSYAPATTTFGQISGTGATFNATNGYVRVVYVPISMPFNLNPFVLIPQTGGLGGLKIGIDPTLNALSATIYDASGTIQWGQNYWDLRLTHAYQKRTDAVMSWDFTASTPNGAGPGRVRLSVDGNAPGALLENPPGNPVWPSGIASAFTIGYDAVNGTVPGAVIERIEFGPAPGMISPAQSKSMTETYYGRTLRRVCAIGDSITGFFDSYHSLLGQLLGRDQCVVINQGWSGNYSSSLNGVSTAIYPNTVASRIPYDVIAHGFNDVIVLAGINDILFGNETDSTVIGRLQDLYSQLAALGLRVFACTIMPSRNNTFGSWTSQKGQYTINVNAWIKSKPSPLSGVCDLYSFLDDGTGAIRGGVGGLFTYDRLHPTHGISTNGGPGADAMALLMFLQLYNNTQIKTSGVPVVSSYSAYHGVAGNSVVINGSFFGQILAVDFAGIPTSFQFNSPNQITATVPTIITNGPISVATANGRAAGPMFTTP